MTDDRRLEELVRADLVAEADDLPFAVDAGAVRVRLTEKRRAAWRLFAVVPVAAAAVLAVLIGQALLAGSTPGAGPEGRRWGPLAVVPGATGDQALTFGTLRITEACVHLESRDGESGLLVWPAESTRWEAESRSIRYSNPDGSEHLLGDGDQVSLGGGGDSTSEGGVPPDEWAGNLEWTAPPDPSCLTEGRWFVNGVVSVSTADIPMPDELMSAGVVEPPPGAITESDAVDLARRANAQVGDTPIVRFMEVRYDTPDPDSPLASFEGWVILSTDIYQPRFGPIDTPQGSPAFGCAWVFVDVDGEIVADWSDGCPDPLSSLPSAAGAAVPTPAGVTREEAITIAAAADPDSSAHVIRAEAGLFGDLVGRALAAYVDNPPPADRWVWLVNQATRPGFGGEGSVVIIDMRTGEVHGVVEWIS